MYLRVFFSLRAQSLLGVWVRIELNMLRFLLIISTLEVDTYSENVMKYFIVQSFASAVFIFSSCLSMIISPLIFFFVYLAILVKLGLAPFHSWFLNLIELSSLNILFLLSTVQKIIPLYILSSLKEKWSLIFALVLTLFVRVRAGRAYIGLKALLAASSIRNLVWVVISREISLGLAFWFFFIYSLNLLMLIRFLIPGGKDLTRRLGNKDVWIILVIFIVFLSLGGVPPFVGFFAKLVVLKELSSFISRRFLLLVLFCSGLIIVFYINYSFRSLRISPRDGHKVPSIRGYVLSFTRILFIVRPFLLFVFFN